MEGSDEQQFQLTELTDMLDGDSGRDESSVAAPGAGGTGGGGGGGAVAAAADPSSLRSAGERTASAFWRCCQEKGLTAFCDALTFSGLRDELPRLAEPGMTVLCPTNEAFAQLSDHARSDQRVVRQLLLGHICPGLSTFADIQAKHCAVAVAGQTHAVYADEGYTFVGTSRLLRTDLSFDGGVVHEIATCLTVLSLVRDSHSEQVWKKSLQPSPILSAVGGVSSLGVEFEIHGCLLHAATGQLVPEALRGHVRQIKPVNEEQRLTFAEITVMTKPPSLAKRRGAAGAPDGSNRYRLLFSIWNTTSLSYISWQHMATPLVVRNSFHMLPLEEKNYRRTQYTISRSGRKKGGGGGGGGDDDDFDAYESYGVLPTLPEGESQQWGSPHSHAPGGPGGDGGGGSSGGGGGGGGGDGGGDGEIDVGDDDPFGGALGDNAEVADLVGHVLPSDVMSAPEWLPLSAAASLPEKDADGAPGAYRPRVRRAESVSTTEDDLQSNDHSSYAAPSIGTGADTGLRDSIGTEPLWLAMSQAQMEPSPGVGPLEAQMQAMASKQAVSHSLAAAAQQRQAASAGVPMFPGATPASSAAVAAAAKLAALSKEPALACSSAVPTFGSAARAGAAGGGSTRGGPSPALASDFQWSLGAAAERAASGEQGAAPDCSQAPPNAGLLLSPLVATAGDGPRLFDSSIREGGCAGGTVVWLHGTGFSEELSVRFGGAAASQCVVVSEQLIKCATPPLYPAVAQSRHEVSITLVARNGGAARGQASIPFTYLGVADEHGATSSLNATQTPKELLRRMLASLERAQAAAAAAAAAGAEMSMAESTHGELGLSAFSAMDEHGYSLAEYTVELKESLGAAGNAFGAAGSSAADAQSDLQLQHQEMAAILKRERLSSSLSKRPSIDHLHQRNILPDAERRRAGAEKLEMSFANRPQMEFLQERNILPNKAKEDGEEQLLAKRKRLESFLVQRPTLEQVQATLGAEAVTTERGAGEGEGGLQGALDEAMGDTGMASTIDAALGAMIEDNSFRSAENDSLRIDDL
jgi:uncharacterized surface protein with fasciclin (FAS1) repeats